MDDITVLFPRQPCPQDAVYARTCGSANRMCVCANLFAQRRRDAWSHCSAEFKSLPCWDYPCVAIPIKVVVAEGTTRTAKQLLRRWRLCQRLKISQLKSFASSSRLTIFRKGPLTILEPTEYAERHSLNWTQLISRSCSHYWATESRFKGYFRHTNQL